jgi:hypothetical protein
MSFIAIVALIAGPTERRRDEIWETGGDASKTQNETLTQAGRDPASHRLF